MIELESRRKPVMAAAYTRRELIDLLEGKTKLIQFDEEPLIKRTNKLEGIMEVVLTLDKLDNSDNL